MHKSHIQFIPEFKPFKNKVGCDMHFRSLCSQKFAKAFFEANKYIEDTINDPMSNKKGKNMKSYYKKRTPKKRECEACGEPFTTQFPKKRACNDECKKVLRIKDRDKRNREAREKTANRQATATKEIDKKWLEPRGSKRRKSLGLKELEITTFSGHTISGA